MSIFSLFAQKNRTTRFGQRRTWKGQDGITRTDVHRGDDYALTYGNDPIHSPWYGPVLESGYSSIYGWYLVIRLNPTTTARFHMLRDRSRFGRGDSVKAGDLLGYTGASAPNAAGNHVHVQVERRGIPIDPRPALDRALAAAAPHTIATPPKVNEEEMIMLVCKPADSARPPLMIAPGWVRTLRTDNGEYEEAKSLASKILEGSAAQYDLRLSTVTQGKTY